MYKSKISPILFLTMFVVIISGCGGSDQNSNITSPAFGTSTTIIPESVKVEKSAEAVTINYQTASPVSKSSIVTSGLSFNNAPLWSDFHETVSKDGLNHSTTIKSAKSGSYFMIYNSAADRYDNSGKGIKIE